MEKKTVKIIQLLSYMVDKLEPDYTLKLQSIEFSSKHGHEICVMQLAGKNAFPKYTANEILSNPKAMVGLSPQDAVTITKLDYLIKERKRRLHVLEIDTNGTIVLMDTSGKVKRYSEKEISSERILLGSMNSEDAHDLGYRVGFREGFSIIKKQEKILITIIKNKIRKLAPLFSKK